MQLRIENICEGIIRIRCSKSFGETLAERYGILHVPAKQNTSGASIAGSVISLPGNRELAFRIRPDDDSDGWQTLDDELNAEFKDLFTSQEFIVGDPNDDHRSVSPDNPALTSGGKFGIAFKIADSERFYGLGEASSDRLELRGRAYQNWVRYQYNEIPIPFVVSSKGWGLFINANSRHFVDIGKRIPDELVVCGDSDELDVFVLYGSGMLAVIQQYTRLTGQPMLLPKWAYGLTYIAPINANQEEVLTHARIFRQEHIPCDMFSLEPGWMEKFYDFSTEKCWSSSRFHMPSFICRGKMIESNFISALHRYGFHLSLWLCCDYDYTKEAERIYSGGEPDHTAWYDHLQPFVNSGIDGFKLDPANMVYSDRLQTTTCANGHSAIEMHNLDQILLAKQVYEGYKKQTNMRPMHHYCGGYAGIQKWSAATTGDNGGELGAMVWLQTLAMSGHMNTTIDMNIHHAESIHFGMLVPWAHLNAWLGAEQPWWAGDKLHRMFKEYAQLRYRLLPYLYSAAIEGHEESTPIVRPMVLEFPDDPACWYETKQYMIGSDLMITAYADHIHLPAGQWHDYWTGETYTGPCDLAAYMPPENRGGGLFVRGGAIIPMWKDRDYISQYDDSEIILDCYPAGKSTRIFREDDGISLDYETQPSCHTTMGMEQTNTSLIVKIGRRNGEYAGKTAKRLWRLRIHHAGNTNVEIRCADGNAACTVEIIE